MTTIKIAAMFCLIILIGLLVAYLYHDSIKDLIGKARNKRPVKKLKNPFDNSPEELQNAPMLYIKLPGWKYKQKKKMEKTPIVIGSRRGVDLPIYDDKKVQPRHAQIRKVTTGARTYYELINLAKINPTQYRNKLTKNKDYEEMCYKDRQELGQDENFYVGDTKIHIKTPIGPHKHSDTESMEIDTENQKAKAGGSGKAKEYKNAQKSTKGVGNSRKKGRKNDDDTFEEEQLSISNTQPYTFDI